MEFRELLDRANLFREKLGEIKARTRLTGFDWYSYDSIGSIFKFEYLLKDERRFLLNLIGDGRVLDAGCGDGDLSFFLESLGCRVDAIDHPATNANCMKGVQALKAALGSAVEIHQVNLDADFKLPHAHYSLILFLGCLYHLKNPIHALETLARYGRYCLLSTRVARVSPDKQTRFESLPVAYLLDAREANNDPTNHWIFSDGGLRRLLRKTGWEICDYGTAGNRVDSDPVTWQGDERAFCLLKSRKGDSRINAELLDGWHLLEQGSWRWTERRFSADLRLPVAGRSTLKLEFALPDIVVERLRSVTLSASVNGTPLEPETYTVAGPCVYSRLLPPEAPRGAMARVEFQLDRALPPDEQDERERGVIVAALDIE